MNKSLLQKLVLLVCSITLTFLLLEGVVRMIGYDPNESEMKRFNPMLGWTIDPARADLDNINELGFRFSGVNTPKSEKTRRILLLGDSFSQDTGLPYAATYAGFLADHLSTVAPEHDWELINLGVEGWGTAQELLALREIGFDYEPDLIILQSFPYNDLCNNALGMAYTCTISDVHRPYMVLDDDDELHLRYLDRYAFLRRSRLFAWIENRIRMKYGIFARLGGADDLGKRQELLDDQSKLAGLEYRGIFYALVPEEHQPEVVREGWRVTERLLGEVVEAAAEAEIPLLGMVIPFERTFEHEWKRFRRRAKDLELQPDYGTRRFEQALADAGAPVLSMRKKILESGLAADDFYSPNGHWYDRHLNRFGHHQTVSWIIDEMVELGLVGDVPRSPRFFEAGDLLTMRAVPLRRIGFWNKPGIDWTGGLGGESSEIVFFADRARDMVLDLSVSTLEEMSRLGVETNGEKVAEKAPMEARNVVWKAELPLRVRAGRNTLRFVYGFADAEKHKDKLVMSYHRLTLRPAGS